MLERTSRKMGRYDGQKKLISIVSTTNLPEAQSRTPHASDTPEMQCKALETHQTGTKNS